MHPNRARSNKASFPAGVFRWRRINYSGFRSAAGRRYEHIHDPPGSRCARPAGRQAADRETEIVAARRANLPEPEHPGGYPASEVLRFHPLDLARRIAADSAQKGRRETTETMLASPLSLYLVTMVLRCNVDYTNNRAARRDKIRASS